MKSAENLVYPAVYPITPFPSTPTPTLTGPTTTTTITAVIDPFPMLRSSSYQTKENRSSFSSSDVVSGSVYNDTAEQHAKIYHGLLPQALLFFGLALWCYFEYRSSLYFIYKERLSNGKNRRGEILNLTSDGTEMRKSTQLLLLLATSFRWIASSLQIFLLSIDYLSTSSWLYITIQLIPELPFLTFYSLLLLLWGQAALSLIGKGKKVTTLRYRFFCGNIAVYILFFIFDLLTSPLALHMYRKAGDDNTKRIVEQHQGSVLRYFRTDTVLCAILGLSYFSLLFPFTFYAGHVLYLTKVVKTNLNEAKKDNKKVTIEDMKQMNNNSTQSFERHSSLYKQYQRPRMIFESKNSEDYGKETQTHTKINEDPRKGSKSRTLPSNSLLGDTMATSLSNKATTAVNNNKDIKYFTPKHPLETERETTPLYYASTTYANEIDIRNEKPSYWHQLLVFFRLRQRRSKDVSEGTQYGSILPNYGRSNYFYEEINNKNIESKVPDIMVFKDKNDNRGTEASLRETKDIQSIDERHSINYTFAIPKGKDTNTVYSKEIEDRNRGYFFYDSLQFIQRRIFGKTKTATPSNTNENKNESSDWDHFNNKSDFYKERPSSDSSANTPIGIRQKQKIPARLWRLLLILAILCGVALMIHATYLVIVAVYIDFNYSVVNVNNNVVITAKSKDNGVVISADESYTREFNENEKNKRPSVQSEDQHQSPRPPEDKERRKMNNYTHPYLDNIPSSLVRNYNDTTDHQNVDGDEYYFPLSNVLYPSTLDAIISFFTEFLPVAIVLYLIRKKKKPQRERQQEDDLHRRRLSSVSSVESLSIWKELNFSPEMTTTNSNSDKNIYLQGTNTGYASNDKQENFSRQSLSVPNYNALNNTFVRAKYGDEKVDHFYNPYGNDFVTNSIFSINNSNVNLPHYFDGTKENSINSMDFSYPPPFVNPNNIDNSSRWDNRNDIHLYAPFFDNSSNQVMKPSENDQITKEDSRSIMGLYNPIN